ncbi:FAD-dependent oxidoreductase [Haladaptatus sp. NG-SE-30]
MTLANVPRYDDDQLSGGRGTAVVVGASMSGLLAARVLADRYEQVTIVERDSLPDEPVARRGVPQASHPHILWEAGRTTLEDLFPGFGEELLSEGGLMFDLGRDFHAYDQGGFFAEGPKRLPLYSASRPLFEQIVRRCVFELDGIDVQPDCQFVDYLVNDSATSVEGVVVRDGGAKKSEVTADLVVDAMGRASRTPTWLEAHGDTPPPVDEVHIDVAYSSGLIERPSDDRRAFFVAPDPPRTRGGAAFPVKGGHWQVNVHGMHGDHPPTEAEAFAEFAASLPVPHLKRLLDTHSWVSNDVDHYPFPSNRRCRYETLDRFPEGLLVIGDAIASFNPIYGQGMSVAALEALQLHHTLAGHDEDLALRFSDRAETVVDTAWMMAVGADCQFSQTEGPTPRGADLFDRYLSRLVRRAHTDGVLADAFARVLTMQQPPTALLHPHIVWRVFNPID